MTPALNEDIFTLIYSHTFDFDVLRATATAIAVDKYHPLHAVVLRRLLQLPLRLSSESLVDSAAFIGHFVHNTERAGLVRDITIILGPSRRHIAQCELYGEEVDPDYLEQAERAEALVKLLPQLLSRTGNLQRLDWSKYPSPGEETLKVLFKRSLVSHLSIDCSVETTRALPEELGIPHTTDIKRLLSTIGPRVTSLDLRRIDEDVFNAIVERFPLLKNVRNLKLDLTRGVWDWDGTGSPQQGPSEQYKFPCITVTNHVEEFDIIISDLLARQQKGPIGLANPKKLTKLRVEVISCFNWVCINFVSLFSHITPTDFSSLTHLIVDDSIRDMRRWNIGRTISMADWQEDGRSYVGMHRLIYDLPNLRHLWVNERVLAIPSSDDIPDFWNAEPFYGDSQDTIMSRTVASPQWELLRCAFERLESLRVGFGPLDASWVARVLSICSHTKLKAFGFDWEWQPGCNKPGVFSELIAALSKFESLTDLHILHPYATLQIPIDYGRASDLRHAIHHLHDTTEMVGLAKELLAELPCLCRVGVGRKSVYERQTRWDTDEFIVQRLHTAEVPPF